MFAQGGRRKNLAAGGVVPDEDTYVFTSLRYDAHAKPHKSNPECCKEARHVYLFKYHFDRLRDAANTRMWFDVDKRLKKPIDLYNRVQYAVSEYEEKQGRKGPYKVRILLRYHGTLEIDVAPEMSPYKQPLLYPMSLEYEGCKTEAAMKRHNIFKVVLDVLPSNKSLHTKFKTEERQTYMYARRIADINSFQDAKEVLLFNKDGDIMDASIHTPYFLRNGKWVTPTDASGAAKGTTRRWAVDQGLCTFGSIKADSLRDGEVIWLSNSVKGFFTARFTMNKERCEGPGYRSPSTSTSSSGTAIGTPVSEASGFKSLL